MKEPGDHRESEVGWVTYLPPGLDERKDYLFVRQSSSAGGAIWRAWWVDSLGQTVDVWASAELPELTGRAAANGIDQVVIEDLQTGSTYVI